MVVADDEDVMRNILSTLLEREHCAVTEAASGEAAVEAVATSEGGVDLLVADVMMPDMTGIETASQIRQQHPQIPVLFLTGFDADTVIGDAADGPLTEVLEKPFETDEFLRAVERLLNGQSAGRTAT